MTDAIRPDAYHGRDGETGVDQSLLHDRHDVAQADSRAFSMRYTDRLSDAGIEPSVGSRADAANFRCRAHWRQTNKQELLRVNSRSEKA